MIVSEYPGVEEVAAKPPEPLIGSSGQMTQHMLSLAGVGWREIYRTNVYKYRPPTPYKKNVDYTAWPNWQECYVQLWNEIETIDPNAILTLGGFSFHILTGKEGLTHYRGSILRSYRQVNGRFIKIIPTFHPVNLLRPQEGEKFDPRARAYMQHDVERAVEEAKTPEFTNPQRLLQPLRGSQDLLLFLNKYRDKKKVVIDIETSKTCIPVCVGLAFSPFHGVSVPLLNVRHGKDETPRNELARIWKILSEEVFQKPGIQLIAHNAKFDHKKLNEVGFGIPYSAIHADTALMAHCLYPEFPKTLEFLTSILSREPYYKDEGRSFDPAKDNPDQLAIYNCKDVTVTFDVYLALLAEFEAVKQAEGTDLFDFYFGYIHKLHELYMRMESNGWRVDRHVHADIWKKYVLQIHERREAFFQMFGYDVNVNAPIQVKDLLFNILKFPNRGSVDEDTLVSLYGNHADTDKKRAAIEYVLDRRRLNKTRSTYLEAEPDYDGRMRTQFNILGTETGRSSTSMLKPPIRPTPRGFAFQTLTKHGFIGQDIRRPLVPDEGMVFGSADMSQAEARIVANLANDDTLLKLFDTIDVHWMTAGWIFDFDGLNVPVDKEDPRRFCGKVTRHGGAYDMRKRRFSETVNSDIRRFQINMPPISEWKAGEMLNKFHKFSPKIRGVFHASIVEHLQLNARVLVNPYGRRRQFYSPWGESLWKEAYAHIPQSTVADHMKQALLRITARKPVMLSRILGEAHDAVVWQSPVEEFAEDAAIIKEELERAIDFSRCSLPRNPLLIPADVEYGFNYKDMKKYRGKVA